MLRACSLKRTFTPRANVWNLVAQYSLMHGGKINNRWIMVIEYTKPSVLRLIVGLGANKRTNVTEWVTSYFVAAWTRLCSSRSCVPVANINSIVAMHGYIPPTPPNNIVTFFYCQTCFSKKQLFVVTFRWVNFNFFLFFPMYIFSGIFNSEYRN